MGRSEQLAHEGLQLCETHGCNLLASGLWIGKAMVAAGRGDWDTARTLTDTMERWAVPRRALCGMCWNSSKQLSVRIGARRQSRKRCSARSPALRSFRHDWHLYRLEVRVSPLRMSKPPSSSARRSPSRRSNAGRSDLARIHLVYGERLRRQRAIVEARVQLTAALEIFHLYSLFPELGISS
jgi:hypothetical protein